jgi:hypothetical protein
MKTSSATFDFSAIELRLLAQVTSAMPVDKLYSEVAKLPKRHPLRFGMLYGMGPRKLYDYVTRLGRIPSRTEHSIRLEAEIQCFENWQQNEARAERNRRFAAQYDLGIRNPDSRMPVPEDERVLTADTLISPTERLCKHEPEMQPSPGNPFNRLL